MTADQQSILDDLTAAAAARPESLRHLPLAFVAFDLDMHQPVLHFFRHGEAISFPIDVADLSAFQHLL